MRTPGRELVLLVALWAVLGCRSAQRSPLSAELRSWPDGAVRWLLLPEDRRAWSKVRSDAEARAFIEWFWKRREAAAPGGGGFRELFAARVEAADRLYGDEGVAGSLTERGGALILLGAPSYIRLSHRSGLAWEPSVGARRTASRAVRVEIWGYLPEDLLPRVRQAFLAAGVGLPPEVRFVSDPRRVRLEDGSQLLDLAARALAGAP